MTNNLLQYPWMEEVGEHINVDIKKLPFPIDVKGFTYYKDLPGLSEGFYDWKKEERIQFYDEVKRASKTCKGCGKQFVDSKGSPNCIKCQEKENGERYRRKNPGEPVEDKKIEARKRLKARFVKVLNTIEYPLKFEGFTINDREQVKDMWVKASQQKNVIYAKNNLIMNLKKYVGRK